MCFSPEADIVTGVLVCAVGIDALNHVTTPEQRPLAALPLVLGAHQLTETFVWWSLQGKVSPSVGDAATMLYLMVAFLLPLWVPLAIRGVETSVKRRRFMGFLAGAGAVVSAAYVGSAMAGPVGSAVGGNYIIYEVSLPLSAVMGTLYVVTTCGAPLMSSDRIIRDFGMVNLVAVAFIILMVFEGLTSLWCTWAAVTSVAIAVYLRRQERAFATA